ncbi:MAG: diaminohydroxyphosphoribosylaminopyrimidine deaminase [Frankiaceae bacterium]|nr:diaminohydroxyphosphoribosylaminopyrimidine deaminase [Frankiaceae bacterium]
MATDAEANAMRRAIELAATGLGTTSPNPVVGCVLLDPAGVTVGEGAHLQGPGNPHAEIVALRAAGDRARGATAVVTLEPCSHTGTTGPCTEAFLDAGVARVVYGVRDTNPVAAGGAAMLRDAGLDVEGGLLEREAARVNEAWLLAVRKGRPFVTWKYAATLDGRSAAADGTSKWISSAESRADVQALRSTVDAIVVGTGTVVADDPALTVRDVDGKPAPRQPLRVVLGRSAVPAGSRVLGDGAILVTAEPHPPLAGWNDGVVCVRPTDTGVDLHEALDYLYVRGMRHVLLEGGPTLAGAFMRAGLVDRVVAYLAPRFLGAGLPALGDAGVPTLAGAPSYRIDDVTELGGDVRITARPLGAVR